MKSVLDSRKSAVSPVADTLQTAASPLRSAAPPTLQLKADDSTFEPSIQRQEEEEELQMKADESIQREADEDDDE